MGLNVNSQEKASRRPATAPFLTVDHRLKRLRFARDHAQGTIDNWKKILHR